MSQAVVDFEAWIEDVREKLPRLTAKLTQSAGRARANGKPGMTAEAMALQAEVHLFEKILQHHDALTREQLDGQGASQCS